MKIHKAFGQIWVAWPLKVEDALERCDGCNNFFGVASVMMREKQFLCGKCHEVAQPESPLGGRHPSNAG